MVVCGDLWWSFRLLRQLHLAYSARSPTTGQTHSGKTEIFSWDEMIMLHSNYLPTQRTHKRSGQLSRPNLVSLHLKRLCYPEPEQAPPSLHQRPADIQFLLLCHGRHHRPRPCRIIHNPIIRQHFAVALDLCADSIAPIHPFLRHGSLQRQPPRCRVRYVVHQRHEALRQNLN